MPVCPVTLLTRSHHYQTPPPFFTCWLTLMSSQGVATFIPVVLFATLKVPSLFAQPIFNLTYEIFDSRTCDECESANEEVAEIMQNQTDFFRAGVDRMDAIDMRTPGAFNFTCINNQTCAWGLGFCASCFQVRLPLLLLSSSSSSSSSSARRPPVVPRDSATAAPPLAMDRSAMVGNGGDSRDMVRVMVLLVPLIVIMMAIAVAAAVVMVVAVMGVVVMLRMRMMMMMMTMKIKMTMWWR